MKSDRTALCAGLVLAMCSSGAGAGTTVFVRANLATGADNGTSWADAFRGRLGLQAAIASVPAGSAAEVWVARGEYAPTGVGGDRGLSIQMTSGVSILGGFAGGEVSAAERDPIAHLTVLTGDLQSDDGEGVFDHTGENSWHVVRIVGAGPSTVIDGFTIRDGYAENGPSPIDIQGAGMLIEGGSPTIRRCVFLDSRADDGAGLAVLGAGEPVIEGCLFTQNNSASRGAGIFLDAGCDATIKGCGFVENAGSNGVGVYSLLSSPVIGGCLFLRNTSPNSAPSGGGIHASGGAPIIRQCEFLHNESQGGGAIWLGSAGAEISRCRFVGNVGTNDGGDVLALFDSETLVTNCELIGTGDTSDLDPSGVLALVTGVVPAPTRFVNCTFSNNGNSAGLAGPFSGHSAVAVGNEGGVTLENCVISGNFSFFVGAQAAAVSVFAFNLPVFDRCIVQGWDGSLPGTGTVALDPMFVDADGPDGVRGTVDDDVRLSASSPCIDAGINAALPMGETFDAAGLPRFRDDPSTPDTGVGGSPIVDLGAHEFQPPPCAGDANNDGAVDFGDITHILAHWGSPFGFADITQTLAAWGMGC